MCSFTQGYLHFHFMDRDSGQKLCLLRPSQSLLDEAAQMMMTHSTWSKNSVA